MTSAKELATLYDAVFESELAKLHVVQAEENALRQTLEHLTASAQESETDSQDIARKSIGADQVWQHWVGRQRAQVNMQLASVVAKRMKMQEMLHRAFGRKEAAALLVKEEAKKDKAQQKKRDLAALEAMLVRPPVARR